MLFKHNNKTLAFIFTRETYVLNNYTLALKFRFLVD